MRFACPVLLPCLAAVLFLPGLQATRAADDTTLTLRKGERIVFLGDSITEAGERNPKGFVQLIRKELKEKHPDLGIEVIGAGISGNKVPDLQKRLERDVLRKKPTVVVIYIGINDVWHGERNPALGTPKDRYEAGLKDVIGRIKDAGARVVLCTPSVIGEKKGGGNSLDTRLDEYAAISRAVAKETHVYLCDLHSAFREYLQEHNPQDGEKGVLTADRVHLNDAGNRFVAERILKCLGE
jgi:lysophospholipase L1-like esterase